MAQNNGGSLWLGSSNKENSNVNKHEENKLWMAKEDSM
jgi:hypothetical protein